VAPVAPVGPTAPVEPVAPVKPVPSLPIVSNDIIKLSPILGTMEILLRSTTLKVQYVVLSEYDTTEYMDSTPVTLLIK
jgi:hypothetical protein